MPELKNYRHELFAQAYIATYANASQAAIAAGYSPKSAGKQGNRLSKNATVRARIAELAVAANIPGIEAMEQARAKVFTTLLDISAASNSDMARVQACKTAGDFLLVGEAGERVKLQTLKLEIEKERIALQREQLKHDENAKNVSITLDSSLMDAISNKAK